MFKSNSGMFLIFLWLIVEAVSFTPFNECMIVLYKPNFHSKHFNITNYKNLLLLWFLWPCIGLLDWTQIQLPFMGRGFYPISQTMQTSLFLVGDKRFVASYINIDYLSASYYLILVIFHDCWIHESCCTWNVFIFLIYLYFFGRTSLLCLRECPLFAIQGWALWVISLWSSTSNATFDWTYTVQYLRNNSHIFYRWLREICHQNLPV